MLTLHREGLRAEIDTRRAALGERAVELHEAESAAAAAVAAFERASAEEEALARAIERRRDAAVRVASRRQEDAS
jgi:hypothetical protein